MNKSRRITIKDIAAEMDVASSTVSKALTNQPGVSEATRQEIIETARRMGYKVNKLARSLARTPIRIGIVLPSVWSDFYAPIRKGLERCANRYLDYNVSVLFEEFPSLYSGVGINKAIDHLIQEKVDAVILSPASVTDLPESLDRLSSKKIPLVLLGTDLEGSNRVCCVRIDADKAGRLSAEFLCLISPENSKIAVFVGARDMKDHREKAQGFERELGTTTHKILGIFETQDEPEIAYHLTQKLLKERDELRSIYVATGNSASVCRAIQENGMQGKISVVGTDVTDEIVGFMQRGLIRAVVFQNPEKIGELGLQVVVDMLLDRKTAPAEILVKPQIMLKNSL